MQVYAHRGASVERPENTLAAFARAVEHGAHGIELDVVRTRDGRLAVIHDWTLDRTTGGTGPVGDVTAADLGRLDAGDGEHVPTLEEVLALVAGKARVNIELKEAECVDGVLAAVAEHPNLDWFASSARWDALELIRERAGADVYPLSLGSEENLEAMRAHARRVDPSFDFDAAVAKMGTATRTFAGAVAFATRVGAKGISIWENGITAERIAEIHRHGLEAWVWTINDPERAKQVIAMGADAICTDDPAAILRVGEEVSAP